MKRHIIFITTLLLVLSILSCSSKGSENIASEITVETRNDHTIELAPGYLHTTGTIFRTNVNCKYKFDRPLEKVIFARLDSVDLSLNPFNTHSTIYKVNNNIPVEVDDWFIRVFNRAQEISHVTGGVYDITAAPLINLWGFGYEKMEEPTQHVIDSVKKFVGYQKVRLEGRKVVKDDLRLQLNASSIAKGFAVDVVAELLESYGIEDYMVEIGGEVRAKGLNPKGNVWGIGITKPIDDNTGGLQPNERVIALNNASLATSGNSRNYYIKDGKKYAHTINPITGYSELSNLLSATVIMPDCMTADALATAFMAMGLDKSLAVAKHVNQIGYVFIYQDKKGDFRTISSEGL